MLIAIASVSMLASGFALGAVWMLRQSQGKLRDIRDVNSHSPHKCWPDAWREFGVDGEPWVISTTDSDVP